MKFDDITVLLGEFGRYQKQLYFLVCLPTIFTGLQMLSPVFTLAIPKHRCKIPSISEDTFALQGAWHEKAINQSIPWVEKDNEWQYSSCDIYIITENTTFDNLSAPVNAKKKSCKDWVYDKSVFHSTFITKENLICGKEFARANANMILMGGVLCGAIFGGIFADMWNKFIYIPVLVVVLLLCSHFHNDVPPEPQQNVSMAAVWGAITCLGHSNVVFILFGRKTAMLAASLLHVAGGCGSAFAPNYGSFVAFRFLVGMSNMGIFLSTFVVGVELVGPSKRVFAGIIIEFFWCVGLYLLNIIAFFVRDWNILQIVIVAFAPLLIAYIWIIPESPRWLLSRGKFNEAEEIIKKCAKVNGVKLPEPLIDRDTLDEGEKQSVLKMFTSPRLLLRTLIIYLNWMVVSMVYYGLGLNVGNLDGDLYVNFAINTSMEVAAYILCLLVLEKVGRKLLHAGTMLLGGVACLCTIFTVLYADESLKWITVVLANIGKFGISAAFAVIYVWSAELFPTMVRNSGVGSSSMMARVGAMVSPYIADLGNLVEGNIATALPLIIFGGLSVLAGVASLALPETKGKVLPESIDDAKSFGRGDPSEVSKVQCIKFKSTSDVPLGILHGNESETGIDNLVYKDDHL